jgi:hypothetical protein
VRARARGEAIGIHEILRVRAQPQREPVDVARDGCRTLRRQATVDEVPGEVLLDEVHAEQVAQPRQNLRRTGILDLRDAVAERLPLQQLAVRTRRLDQLAWFALKRAAASAATPWTRAQSRRDVGDHLLDATREQLVLLLGAAQLDRPRRRAEVGDRLTESTQARTVEDLACGLLRGERRELRGIRALELLRIVGEQALADQLQGCCCRPRTSRRRRGPGAGPPCGSRRKPDPPHASRASWMVDSAFHVERGLSAAASVSRSSRSCGVSVRPENTPSNLRSNSSLAKNCA